MSLTGSYRDEKGSIGNVLLVGERVLINGLRMIVFLSCLVLVVDFVLYDCAFNKVRDYNFYLSFDFS